MKVKNQNIINIIKAKSIALIIFSIIELFAIILLCSFLGPDEELFINLFVIAYISISLIMIITFYRMHISRALYFIDKDPIECTIEDLVLVSYGYSDSGGISRKDYRLYPVVKANNELYFTYGNYCISHYNQTYSRMNDSYIDICIHRKDWSKVNIGDTAYLYIKKNLDIKVDIDVEKNQYKLNKQVEYFNNFNKIYDINLMKNLNYFEGIIDIEKMQ